MVRWYDSIYYYSMQVHNNLLLVTNWRAWYEISFSGLMHLIYDLKLEVAKMVPKGLEAITMVSYLSAIPPKK
jgi:hypothetical protein